VRVLIIGAGGHGQVVADVLLTAMAEGCGLQPVGYLDDEERLNGQRFLALSVLGPIREHRQFDHDAVIVAIGDNARIGEVPGWSRQRGLCRRRREHRCFGRR
jgi:FlaA1/EpsC-like NDP-sugar epimerase